MTAQRREIIEDCIATLGMTLDRDHYCGATLRDVFILLKGMADAAPVNRIAPTFNYASVAIEKAKAAARPGLPGVGTVSTPAGLLECRIERKTWEGPKRGVREAWSASWTLDGQTVPASQLRFLGLVCKRRRRTKAEMRAASNNN